MKWKQLQNAVGLRMLPLGVAHLIAVLVLPYSNSVTVVKPWIFYGPVSSHTKWGPNDIFFVGICGIKLTMHVKYFVQCLAHNQVLKKPLLLLLGKLGTDYQTS